MQRTPIPRPIPRYRLVFLLAALFAAALPVPLGGAAGPEPGDVSRSPGYRMPPKAIADLVDAKPTPRVSLDPTRKRLLIMELPSLPPIAEVAQPELRLAGLRINPRTNGPSRRSYYTGLRLIEISDGSERAITGLPPAPRIRDVQWSPDGAWIAFTLTVREGIELWAAETASGRSRRLTDPCLNAAIGPAFRWFTDSRTLVVRVVPEDRGEAPKAPEVPRGPVIRENRGRKAPARTYQDLLKNPHDEECFAYYLRARVALVSMEGALRPIGTEGLVTRASPSPDGKYILVETLHRPFSYLVPVYRFPRRVEVWDREGTLVVRVADLPLAESVPIGFDAVPGGPRSIGWRADAPATLYWVEAQDGGDPRRKAEVRDTVFTLPAPFRGKPEPLVTLGLRAAGVTWGRGDLALVSESWWRTRRTRTWIVDPSDPASKPVLLFDRSYEDRYNDPGSPVLARTPYGTSVLRTAGEGRTIFLSGRGASPEGDRPFLDRLDLDTRGKERLWRSAPPYYEQVVDILDEEGRVLLTRRESVKEPPNYFVRDPAKNTVRPLTHFPHPTPQLAEVKKELIRYRRADGVQLTANLYLPPGYVQERDGPLPMLVWAYPREYKRADLAGQVRDSPYRFVRVRWSSPLPWLTQGYAVLDNPAMPIVGEGDAEPNDTFVEQLCSSAKAAVDAVVARGVADPARVAVGGHSYGAFMTANLLAHSDIFCAGIARSGAYNRTLTPFGFQSEERTLWEAPEIYFAMSPFMHAQKINEPILLIHGEADNNSGTFPLQSERFYHALKGLGATVRLVLLPHESHGYRARESVMHTLWEMNAWLERYVKHRRARDTVPAEGTVPTGGR